MAERNIFLPRELIHKHGPDAQSESLSKYLSANGNASDRLIKLAEKRKRNRKRKRERDREKQRRRDALAERNWIVRTAEFLESSTENIYRKRITCPATFLRDAAARLVIASRIMEPEGRFFPRRCRTMKMRRIEIRREEAGAKNSTKIVFLRGDI